LSNTSSPCSSARGGYRNKSATEGKKRKGEKLTRGLDLKDQEKQENLEKQSNQRRKKQEDLN
jgi:hypothetical protein